MDDFCSYYYSQRFLYWILPDTKYRVISNIFNRTIKLHFLYITVHTNFLYLFIKQILYQNIIFITFLTDINPFSANVHLASCLCPTYGAFRFPAAAKEQGRAGQPTYHQKQIPPMVTFFTQKPPLSFLFHCLHSYPHFPFSRNSIPELHPTRNHANRLPGWSTLLSYPSLCPDGALGFLILT